MKLKRTCLAAGIFMTGLGSTSIAGAETIKEAINGLIETYPEVRSVAYQRLGRDEEIRQARADWYPRLDFSYGAGTQEFYKPNEVDRSPTEMVLSARWNLFTGFATQHNIDRTKSNSNAGAYRVQSTAEEIGLEGSRAYMAVLRRQKLLELAEENLTNHLRIGDQLKMRSKSGLASRADIDQIASRIALARTTVVAAESNLQDEITRYYKLMGHLPQNLVDPDSMDMLVPESLDDAQRKALVNHPALKAIEEDLSARKSQVGIAKSEYYPVIDLEVDRRWDDEVDGADFKEEDLLAMVRLRFNIFRGFGDKGRISQTRFLVDDAIEARNNVARQILENIRLAWMSYENARRQSVYMEERVATSKSTVDAYGKQFRIGKRTLLDVLDAEAEWIDSRRNLIDEQNNYRLAQFRLLSGTGNLVPSLGLEYPEEAIPEYVEEDEKKDS
jgi:adhesin transport system outer membrane protein